MRIELHCSACYCRFVAPAEASDEEVREQMFNDGPWYALGDGNTFEDMIFSTLTERGAICCPDCGDPVSVSEESLGQMAMEMLARLLSDLWGRLLDWPVENRPHAVRECETPPSARPALLRHDRGRRRR